VHIVAADEEQVVVAVPGLQDAFGGELTKLGKTGVVGHQRLIRRLTELEYARQRSHSRFVQPASQCSQRRTPRGAGALVIPQSHIVRVAIAGLHFVGGVVVGCGRCRQTNQPPTLFAAVVPRLTGLRP
jgi:hypothetical protein